MKFDFEFLENFRITEGEYKTNSGDNFGCFSIPYQSTELSVIATDGDGLDPRWEHVSVSLKNRCPNWNEMCFVKRFFWTDDERVIQIHPNKIEYINQHPNCLHLWKKYGEEIEMPPSIYVGIKRKDGA